MTDVSLYTAYGSFVTTVQIPPFLLTVEQKREHPNRTLAPDVITWGYRTFMYHPASDSYRECFVYVVG